MTTKTLRLPQEHIDRRRRPLQHIVPRRAHPSATSDHWTTAERPIRYRPPIRLRRPPYLPCIAHSPQRVGRSATSLRVARYTTAYPQFALRRPRRVFARMLRFLPRTATFDTWLLPGHASESCFLCPRPFHATNCTPIAWFLARVCDQSRAEIRRQRSARRWAHTTPFEPSV